MHAQIYGKIGTFVIGGMGMKLIPINVSVFMSTDGKNLKRIHKQLVKMEKLLIRYFPTKRMDGGGVEINESYKIILQFFNDRFGFLFSLI